MWSGRFRQALDPEFEKWQRSFPYDRRLLPFELAASRAHANALEHTGVLSSGELSEIVKALADIGRRAESSPEFLIDPEAEDVHHFVEKQLAALIGPTGYKLHTGRSRNEQIATDLRLFARQSIDNLENLIAGWIDAILARAERAGVAAMPAYTHLQPAEPVLVAHWLLAYVEMFFRDAGRLADCRRRVNLCPLGSGAVAGATLNLNRQAMAAELGFDGPTTNSIDATSDRDFALEYVQAAATLGIHISRFAEEITLFATSEFGFIELPESFSTGSSAMPQKKNPDMTELLRGKSGRLLGAATTLATLLKGLPLAYNKDLQETQEPVFAVADTLEPMLQLLPKFTRAFRFRNERMESAAQSGYLNAMAAATYLVHKGVPFRTAHEKIGNAVRFALEKSVELDQLSLAELRAFGPEFAEDFFAAIGLSATLDCHEVMGGTARGRVRTAIDDAAHRIAVLANQKTREIVHAGA